jgi:hypothetical protein
MAGCGVGGRLLVLWLGRRWRASRFSDALRGRSKGECRGGVAQAAVVPPVRGRRSGRQPGSCGGAGGGGGRPVAADSPAAGRSGNHHTGGAPSRTGPTPRPRASDDPADLDQGPPGAGGPVATGGSAGSMVGRFHAPGRWRVLWSFNCQSFGKYGGGNVKLSGGRCLRGGLGAACWGQGTGRLAGHWWRPGRLTVESVCDRWMVKAVAP